MVRLRQYDGRLIRDSVLSANDERVSIRRTVVDQAGAETSSVRRFTRTSAGVMLETEQGSLLAFTAVWPPTAEWEYSVGEAKYRYVPLGRSMRIVSGIPFAVTDLLLTIDHPRGSIAIDVQMADGAGVIRTRTRGESRDTDFDIEAFRAPARIAQQNTSKPQPSDLPTTLAYQGTCSGKGGGRIVSVERAYVALGWSTVTAGYSPSEAGRAESLDAELGVRGCRLGLRVLGFSNLISGAGSTLVDSVATVATQAVYHWDASDRGFMYVGVGAAALVQVRSMRAISDPVLAATLGAKWSISGRVGLYIEGLWLRPAVVVRSASSADAAEYQDIFRMGMRLSVP